MGYTSRHQELQNLFSPDKSVLKLPNSSTVIRNMKFTSTFTMPEKNEAGFSSFTSEDALIHENWNFSYPVFTPNDKKNNRAIILLHGLNERDWSKYLTWADYLVQHTKRTVILFPLAFHMNRGKKEWSDPRSMTLLASNRKSSYQHIARLSFANAALSKRLTEDPIRFYRAGLQSAQDLLQLLHLIKKGNYPLLDKNTEVNFMGYSIGAFLTQILFMANPGNILKHSKAVLFCGGTTFNNMSGASKLIMDNLAYENLNKFYMQQFELHSFPLARTILTKKLNTVVQSFKAMIPIPAFQSLKERTFTRMARKITAIGLLKDQVIPANEIKETLKDKRGKIQFQLRVIDFPYPYTHENPFPTTKKEQSPLVDKCFENVFSHISRSLI